MQLKNTTELSGTRFFEGIIEGQRRFWSAAAWAHGQRRFVRRRVIRDSAPGAWQRGHCRRDGRAHRRIGRGISSKAGFHDNEPLMESFYPFVRFRGRSFARGRWRRPLRSDAGALFLTCRSGGHRGLLCPAPSRRAVLPPAFARLRGDGGAAVAQAAYYENTPFVIIRTMSVAAERRRGEHY
jgi:hypothetical protein